MPSPGVNRFLIFAATGAFVLEAAGVPVAATTWPAGSGQWAVTKKTGQVAPNPGDIATFDDPTQPWLGVAYFSPPAPVYPPIANQRETATAAVNDYANGLLEGRNGNNRIKQANIERIVELQGIQQQRALTAAEETELAGLQARSSNNAAINERANILIDVVMYTSSQVWLADLIADVANPPDNQGWPADIV